jgi:hypothetical protein
VAEPTTNSNATTARTAIIDVVKQPINFMVLVLLMVEALLGTMAFQFPELRQTLVWVIIIFFATFTLIVIFLAVWKPGVLQGTKNWDKTFSDRLAVDICFAVEGYLENLSQQEKIEAWLSLSDVLRTQDSGDDEFNDFCNRMSERILKKVELSGKKLKAQGTIGT